MNKEAIKTLLKGYHMECSKIYPLVKDYTKANDDYEYKMIEKHNERLYDSLNAYWKMILNKVNVENLGYTMADMVAIRNNSQRWEKLIKDYEERGGGDKGDSLEKIKEFANMVLVNRLNKKYFDCD